VHKSRLGAIIIDCRTKDVEAATAFWGAALGYKVKPTDDPRYIDFAVPEGQPEVGIQKVDHESRVHLDIETDDIEAEAKRLGRAGRDARRPDQVVVGHVGPHRPEVLRGETAAKGLRGQGAGQARLTGKPRPRASAVGPPVIAKAMGDAPRAWRSTGTSWPRQGAGCRRRLRHRLRGQPS
jgi:hypothetical protein